MEPEFLNKIELRSMKYREIKAWEDKEEVMESRTG
jgi:hypothetical protein